MVRQLSIVAATLAVVVTAGCGIKGPLVLPPKPPATPAPATPAPATPAPATPGPADPAAVPSARPAEAPK